MEMLWSLQRLLKQKYLILLPPMPQKVCSTGPLPQFQTFLRQSPVFRQLLKRPRFQTQRQRRAIT